MEAKSAGGAMLLALFLILCGIARFLRDHTGARAECVEVDDAGNVLGPWDAAPGGGVLAWTDKAPDEDEDEDGGGGWCGRRSYRQRKDVNDRFWDGWTSRYRLLFLFRPSPFFDGVPAGAVFFLFQRTFCFFSRASTATRGGYSCTGPASGTCSWGKTVEIEVSLWTNAALATADLILRVEDVSVPPPRPSPESPCPALVIGTKADLPRARDLPGALEVSAHTGEGLSELRDGIARSLGVSEADPGALVIAHERQRDALVEAAAGLRAAAISLEGQASPELVAVDVAEATDALSRLVGLTTIEDVLDRLFSSFCIGK